MYGYDGDSKPIFVDEQLTKYTYTLFAQAKQLKKAGFQTAMFYIDKPTILKLNAFIPTRKSMKLKKKTIMLSKNKAVNKQRQQTGTSDQRNKKREKMNKHDKRNQTQNRHQHTSETDDDEA